MEKRAAIHRFPHWASWTNQNWLWSMHQICLCLITSPSAKGVLVLALASFLPCFSDCLSLCIRHNWPGPSLIVALLRADIWSDRTPLSYGHRHCAEFPAVSVEHMLTLRFSTLPPSSLKNRTLIVTKVGRATSSKVAGCAAGNGRESHVPNALIWNWQHYL